MKFDLSKSVNIHNRYELSLINSITGDIKQTAIAENVVTDFIWMMLGASNMSNVKVYNGIAMGTGSGEPSVNDTDMFNRAFLYNGTFTMLERQEAFPTSSYTVSISIPASTSYVGALTEIGLYGYGGHSSYYGIWSHAMLKDSEGNPITINKTDLDILTITATVYVTFSSTDNKFIWYEPGPRNAVSVAFRTLETVRQPFASGNKINVCTSVSLNDYNCINSIVAPQKLGSSSSMKAADRTHSITTTRMSPTTGNGTYYNAFVIGTTDDLYIGGVLLPNADVFPNQKISNMRVGIGDGVTTNFPSALDYFIEGTDELFVDGVLQQRGIDYTIGNVEETLTNGVMLSNFMSPVSGQSSTTDLVEEPMTFHVGIETGNSGAYRKSEANTVVPSYRIPLSQTVAKTPCEVLLKTHNPFIFKVQGAPCNNVSYLQLKNFLPLSSSSKNLVYFSTFFYDSRQSIDIPDIGLLENPQAVIEAYENDAASVVLVQEPCLLGRASYNRNMHRTVDTTYASFTIRYIKDNNVSCYAVRFTDAEGTTGICLVSDTEEGVTVLSEATGVFNLLGDKYGISPVSSFEYNEATYYSVYLYCGSKHSDYYSEEHSNWSVLACNTFTYNGCKIRLSGSNDNFQWNEIHTVNLSEADTITADDYTEYNNSAWVSVEQTGYKDICCNTSGCYDYYKLELDTSEATERIVSVSEAVMALPVVATVDEPDKLSDISVGSLETAAFALYNEGGITFTNPPANGAVITMNADIDRPYKNENFVLDVAMTLHFGG